MNPSPESADAAAAKAASELAGVQSQVEAMRAVLTRLLQDVVQAESRLDANQAAQLLEANEQMVLTAVRSQTDAETAAQALDQASRSAEHDPLTQLPNRVLLLDRFTHAIARAKRDGGALALLFIDLNDFKQINDTLGHAIGDQVLQRVAACLTSAVRAVDTVSRHGGDEFLILLTPVAQASDAIGVAHKVIAALGAPARFGKHVLRLSASIGISLYPDDAQDAQTLIERADAAMYDAKSRGPGSSVAHAGEAVIERSLRVPFKSLQPPLTEYEAALANHDARLSQLQEANEQLVLAALNAQELQAAAEQAQRRQTEFLAMIAHELRNPLAPIRIATSMLGRVRTEEPLLPRAQAIIERQLAQMTRLINDLLDVSRVNMGQMKIEPQEVDIVEIIDAAIEAIRPAMDTRLQAFTATLPRRTPRLHADLVRLAQVLGNLLVNASKYTPNGGTIGMTLAVARDHIELAIFDSGIGIAADVLPMIFEPFVQETYAIGFNGAGLGVGLTVVRQLVEAHGGTIVASSAGRGLGSRFVVTLPLPPEAV